MIDDTNDEVLRGIVSRKKNSREYWERLASHDNPMVRESVARNNNTPSDILVKLSKDEDYDTVISVVYNDKATDDMIVNAWTSFPNDQIRREILNYPNASDWVRDLVRM